MSETKTCQTCKHYNSHKCGVTGKKINPLYNANACPFWKDMFERVRE